MEEVMEEEVMSVWLQAAHGVVSQSADFFVALPLSEAPGETLLNHLLLVPDARPSSQYERNQSFPAARVVLKPLLVVSVVLVGSGPDGAGGEESEGEGG